MIIVFYVLAWILAAVGAGVLTISGSLNETTVTVVGFVFSALFFAGVVAVLPWWVERQFSPKTRMAVEMK